MMRRFTTILATLGLTLFLGGSAWAAPPPSFGDFPADSVFAGPHASPVLDTRDARLFRTMIRDGSREKINFAGHYIVSSWGCGTDCEMGAIIDAVTGKVAMLPVVAETPADAGDDFDSHFDFRLDSRLIVLSGMIGEQPPMGHHYYRFDGNRLVPLMTVVEPVKTYQ